MNKSKPNLHHEKFCGYGVEHRGKPEKSCVVIWYKDDKGNGSSILKFDYSWAKHVEYLYMKICDMWDAGMSLEAIELYYKL